MLRTKMKTIISNNSALRQALLSLFDNVFGRFGRNNRHLENQIIKIVAGFRYNFLISYVPLLLVRVLAKVFPRLGTICFAIHNKHSKRLYTCWGAFNLGLKVWILDVLSRGEDVDQEFYVACVDGIHSPAVFVEFLRRFDLCNSAQKQVLLNRIKAIILKLNPKNQDLFCKQLLHLLTKNAVRADIIALVMEVIDSCGPDFTCRSYSDFNEAFFGDDVTETRKQTVHSNVVVQNSIFFETDGCTLFLQQVEPTQDRNFFKSNIFIDSSRSVFCYFFRNQFEKTKYSQVNEATLLSVRPGLGKFDILFAVLRASLKSKEFDFRKSDIILVDEQFDAQLVAFFEKFFGCVVLDLDGAQYKVDRLNLLGVASQQALTADELGVYTDLINLITKKMDLNAKQYEGHIVVLTNSFVGLGDDGISNLSEIAKGAGAIYLDIEIATLSEILGAFLYAETIVCGNHKVLSLNLLRKASLATIVVHESQDQLDEVLSSSLSSNVHKIDIKQLAAENLLKFKKSVVLSE